MREIKFRAWDKNINKMLYPPDCWTSSSKTGFSLVSSHGHFVIDNEYVMQYTGFKDKDGVEIYEGDIIKGHSKGTIVFEDGSFVAVNGRGKIIYQFPLHRYTPEPVVVGNIYEKD